MIVAINIFGFIALDLLLAMRLKERHINIIPITVAILLIVLYILSIFRALSWIDYFWIIIIMIYLFWAIKNGQLIIQAKSFLETDTLAMFLTFLFIFLLTRGKIAGSGDELGVWALEVKSMFYENGFAMPNCYAALGYGNYFPGQMLFEVWVCHFSPNEFCEGLMYVGYYWLYACFWMPMLSHACKYKQGWSIVAALAFCVVILLLPSVADSLGYTMLSAEMILSAAFGASLFAYYNKAQHNRLFTFLCSMSCLFTLIFTKESGIYFSLVAVVYGVMLSMCKRQDGKRHAAECIGWKGVLVSALLSLTLAETWSIYCKFQNRTSYFAPTISNSLVTLTHGEYAADQLDGKLIESFFRSLIFEPLTSKHTAFVNLSVAGFLIIILLILILFFKKKIMNEFELIQFTTLYSGALVIYLIILLGMHLFVFREPQYIDSSIMIISVARYAQPLFLGVLGFLLMVFCTSDYKLSDWKKIILIFASLAVFANFKIVWDSTINYTQLNQGFLSNRFNLYKSNAPFITAVRKEFGLNCINGRILYVHKAGEDLDSMDQRVLRYMLQPQTVAYLLYTDDTGEDRFISDLNWELNAMNCKYIYIDDVPDGCGDNWKNFTGYLISVE